MARAIPEVPAGMRKVHQSFARWRRSRTGRSPIPESLWRSAAKSAKEYGVFRTSQILHLDYCKLKQRVGFAGIVPRGTAPAPAFVELEAPAAMEVAECVIELEGPRGKMRISWKGSTPPDLSALSRALWEQA